MAGFPQMECLSFIKNDIKIFPLSKYGASMARDSAQKGNLHVSQLISHCITLKSSKDSKMCTSMKKEKQEQEKIC